MFQARLKFADMNAPIALADGGIFLGDSFVSPVRHRMLHTTILESPRAVAIVSRERFADDPQGIDFESALSDAVFEARLAELQRHLLDVTTLLIDRRGSTVRYRTSPLVSVPVYLAADPDGAALDWDYSRLLAGRDTAIVWPIALAQIAGFQTYAPQTIVAGIHLSTADTALVITRDGVTAELPQPIAHDGPQTVANGADLEAVLFDTVTSLITSRPIARDRTALELSGGMDSALTSLAAAAGTGPGLMSIGAQFDGAMGDEQRKRRRMLCERGGFDDLDVPAGRLAPFSPTSLRRVRHGVLPDDENYPEIFEAIFAILQAAGIDTLISGYGGDELYFAYEGEEAAHLADPPHSPFLTAAGRRLANAGRSTYPRGWLQESCWQSAAGQAQRLLRYGLWPIYPYHTLALARFISRLPWEHRRDRRLLRTTLSRVLGDPVFETDYVKESFYPVAVRGIAENGEYLADLVRRSPLSRQGYIDQHAILTALQGDIAALSPDDLYALFRALKIFCFFGEPTLTS